MNSKYLLFCVSLVSLFLFASCNEDSLLIKNDNTSISSSRPYSPWVFRSVLDARPRMITFALEDGLYASYSTQTGALYKTWKGNVLFEGAVYNSAHGPQPITLGDAYFINKHDNPWILKKKGKEIDFDFQYNGHRYTDVNHAEMNYTFTADGQSFQVIEIPDSKNEDGQLVFKRSFETINMPDGMELSLKTNLSSIILEEYISTDGDLAISTKEERGSSIKVLDIDGVLTLKNNAKTNLDLKLSDKALITNPNNALFSEDQLAGNEGKELIGKNDCKSCHNTYVKTIGPAYLAVAKKYKTNEGNLQYLVGKVLKGGSGVWGQVPMTAHPELPEEDAVKMVEYILTLDKDTEIAGEDEVEKIITKDSYFTPQPTEGKGLVPGAIVKVYDIPVTTNKMPDFSKMTPKMAGVLPDFDNLEGNDFTKLESYFGLTGEGYLEILEDQEIAFRMWSDDGSKLYINDQLVVDNDGNHGTEYKENTIGMKAGLHRFRIEFYQGLGGSFLSFNWKPANNEAWQVVPLAKISHDAAKHTDIDGLTLPMSTTTQIPGDKISLDGIHPSFDLRQARPESFLPKVGGLDVLKDGRIILSTWDPDGSVYLVDYKNAKTPEDITYKKIASGLAEPLGVKVVGDDIYIMQKQEMTQLIDHNGDEIIDEYKVLTNSWGVSANFHEFGFGLAEKDDFLYATLAIGIMPGGASAIKQPKDRGRVIKVNRKTGDLEFIAHGLRTPNGIGIGYNGDVFVADNQGDWLPASKILHVTKDAFFNSRAIDFKGTADLPVKNPVVWLPQNDIGNSPSTPVSLDVGPYKDQMIHGEVTHGGLKRVFVEEVNGELQGGLFRFSQGFEAGINRIAWADKETLIVGGIGNPGNWQQNGKKWYGLQEIKYNGKSTFEMLAVRAKTNGIEIEFTEALSAGDGWDPDGYKVEQWYYTPTIEYGGPKLGLTDLKVQSASVSEDRKKVFLEIPGIKKEHVVHLLLQDKFISAEDHTLWTTECWYTMNSIPQNAMGQVQKAPEKAKMNSLTDAEKAAGWKMLFDGNSTKGIRNYQKETIGSSWKVSNGELFLDSEKKEEGGWQAKDGGDILITDKEYENYELNLEWKISNCGNSGIIYNVVESEEYGYVWMTGPEMQILDNTCHPDTKFATHRSGDLYDMLESKYVTAKPAGEWNKIRLISKNGTIQHWQNGYKIIEYQNNNKEWEEMISYSKFKDMPGFGKSTKGHISLQDHGDPVFFRNIKIREL